MEIDEDTITAQYPQHLNNTHIRPNGIEIPDMIKINYLPINNNATFNKNYNKIIFQFNSQNLLDPYSLYFDFIVRNVNDNPIQLDHSAHSIISSIAFYANDLEIEKIENYDFIHSLIFDMSLGRNERSRRKEDEGFGTNRYGTDETIIPPLKELIDPIGYEKMKFQSIFRGDNFSLSTAFLPRADVNSTVPFITHNDVMTFEKDKDLLLPYSKRIPNINEWEYTINGKLAPEATNSTSFYDKVHEKRFRIPLMLKTIGFGQQTDNYKLVPLELFGKIKIEITLNPSAFFVPVPMQEFSYFESDKFQGKSCKIEYPNPSNEYEIIEPRLMADSYRFNPTIHSQLINQVKNSGWALDYLDFEIIHSDYVKFAPILSITKPLARKNIRAFHIVFTNDLHKQSVYARKLARYNRGFKKVVFRQGGFQYPPNSDKIHNSLNSHGDENAQYFYNELLTCTGKTNDYRLLDFVGHDKDNRDSVLSLSNFCLDFDASHLWGIKDYVIKKASLQADNKVNPNDLDILYNKKSFTDLEWTKEYLKEKKNDYIYNSLIDSRFRYFELENINNFNKALAQPTSKCIYTINFDKIPHSSKLYKGGIELKYDKMFFIELERIRNYEYNDIWSQLPYIFFLMHGLIESYKTLVITPSGSIEFL